jgi:hypothetical protein
MKVAKTKVLGQNLVRLEIHGDKGSISVANLRDPNWIISNTGFHTSYAEALDDYNSLDTASKVVKFCDR